MNKWLITSAYCKEQMLKDLLEFLYHRDDGMMTDFKHVIIDQHYPIKDYTCLDMKNLAQEYDCIYIDSLYNRGLFKGMSHAMRFLDVSKEDLFIRCDPDARPSRGSFQAIQDILMDAPGTEICALSNGQIHYYYSQQPSIIHSVISGHNCWVKSPLNKFSVGAYNLQKISNWLDQIRNLTYLKDFNSEADHVNKEDPDLCDSIYEEYKAATFNKKYLRSFKEYLTENTNKLLYN